jgi:hypothetical protein
MATVQVTVSDNQLSSANNPKEVSRGEMVTWEFIDPDGQGRALLVEFRGLMSEDGSSIIQGRSPFQVPFPLEEGTNSGIVDDAAISGLYGYVVRNGDNVLRWATPILGPGTFEGNFGGIIIKDPG